MDETTAYLSGLSPIKNKEVCARFDGGRLSSDGGVLLLPVNLSAALEWYRKAKTSGIPAASYALGTMYYRGSGVEKNYDEAAKLISEAANAGIAQAQQELGLMYSRGHGFPKSLSQTFKWMATKLR